MFVKRRPITRRRNSPRGSVEVSFLFVERTPHVPSHLLLPFAKHPHALTCHTHKYTHTLWHSHIYHCQVYMQGGRFPDSPLLPLQFPSSWPAFNLPSVQISFPWRRQERRRRRRQRVGHAAIFLACQMRISCLRVLALYVCDSVPVEVCVSCPVCLQRNQYGDAGVIAKDLRARLIENENEKTRPVPAPAPAPAPVVVTSPTLTLTPSRRSYL